MHEVLLFKISNFIEDSAAYRRRTISIFGLRLWWPFPIASMLRSGLATVFGCPVYGGKENVLVRYAYTMFKFLSDIKYAIKYRLMPTRYHWIDTGLGPGYHDPVELLLHSSMTILGRYIDEMGGFDAIDKFNAELRNLETHDVNAAGFCETGIGDHENSQANSQEEAATIWRWWTEERPRDEKRRDDLLHRLYGEGRVSWKKTENSQLSEIVFADFVGDDVALHKELRELENKINDDENSMLSRLINIRQTLWT